MKEKILVTGLGGRLGTILYNALKDEFAFTALNRSNLAHVPTVSADITDFNAIQNAFAGQDVVIHLAAYPFSDDNWAEILPVNIVGTYNVLESARRAGVKRFLFGSSLAVLGQALPRFLDLYKNKPGLTAEEKKTFLESVDMDCPDTLYGSSKVFGEALCRQYAGQHAMSCVILRFAEVRPDDRPNPEDPWGHVKMCFHRDFVFAVRQAIDATRKPTLETLTLISDDYGMKVHR